MVMRCNVSENSSFREVESENRKVFCIDYGIKQRFWQYWFAGVLRLEEEHAFDDFVTMKAVEPVANVGTEFISILSVDELFCSKGPIEDGR